MLKHPATPWVLPFALFMLMLGVAPRLGLPPLADLSLRLLLPALAVAVVSRHLLAWRCERPWISIAIGVGVFVVWVAPDMLVPGYRDHWLFQNVLTGEINSTFVAGARLDPLALTLRILRAVVLVPIVEELFWRGWLMRWLIDHNFTSVPLGTYAPAAFWITAGLFALEHGPYWEVGFLAGAVYNWWMVRTKRLSDLILAHAVTNACLAGFVLVTERWEYWM